MVHLHRVQSTKKIQILNLNWYILPQPVCLSACLAYLFASLITVAWLGSVWPPNSRYSHKCLSFIMITCRQWISIFTFFRGLYLNTAKLLHYCKTSYTYKMIKRLDTVLSDQSTVTTYLQTIEAWKLHPSKI